jgi:ribose 5-phosphate isomerase B
MSKRPLITERDVRRAHDAGQRTLAIAPNALVTALARDFARDHGIALTERAESEAKPDGKPDCGCTPAAPCGCPDAPPRTLALGCDHAGFAYKQALADHARSLGWTVTDVGTDSDARCDYPDFAYAVARLVALGEVQLGLMIDGVGVGSAIVANKLPTIRAACCASEFAAFNARAHNDANVLTLGSRTEGIEVCKGILYTFLKTDFEGGRHAERVQKIADVEARFLPGSPDAL